MRATRRQLIIGGAAAAFLAACGSSSGAKSPRTTGASSSPAPPDRFALVRRFPVEMLVPGELRLPVSIADGAGNLQGTGPETLHGAVLDINDKVLFELDAVRRNSGTQIAYWAFRPTIDAPGIYTLRAEGDNGQGAAFEVFTAEGMKLPHRGAKLPPFDTPTVSDHRGVEPYCSHSNGPCPLHEITLTQALAGGTPVAYLVGTPGHCETGTCEPGLDFLVSAHERLGPALACVHADVYADDAATTVAPAVKALGIEFEPALFLCSADGTIVDHLDGIWDRSELDEVLAKLVS